MPAWFEAEPEIRVGEHLGEGSVECVLRPLPALIAGQFKVLPPEGASGTLVLSGNCGDRELPLRVFNILQFRFAVDGEGVQADPPGAPSPERWSLGKPGLQDLTIRVWPGNGRLYLPEIEPGAAAPDPADPQFSSKKDFRLVKEPGRGVAIGPARPAVLRLEFDISEWQHRNPETLRVRLGAKVPMLLPPEVLTFFRQAVGNLKPEPDLLQLPSALFYGEQLVCPSGFPSKLLPPRVLIRNKGEDFLRVSQPQVIVREGPAGVEWLRAVVSDIETEIEIDVDEARVLLITFDLSEVTSENYPPGGFFLRLMSWGDGTGVPTSAEALAIVGIDNNNLLHIRIFDQDGRRVTDTDETRLPTADAQAISTLKQQLPGLLPPHVLTEAERARVLGEAMSIVGRTLPGNPLSAEIRFTDVESALRTWSLEVMVPEVRARPALEFPLAIDFGNTNTFAAVVDLDVPGRIRPVLGDSDPETFPTALCFTDPARREFEIGTEAVQRGGIQEGMLVRGLKRELARRRTADEPEKHAFFWKGQTFRFSRDELIGLFLEEVLRECERKLRRTVTHMGLSYPANFGARSIAQLDKAIDRLRKTWVDEYPDEEIRFEKLDADEATAVALGFVLDRQQFDSIIWPRLILEGRNPFLVVSFDFGGGSIDCALIRFRSLGEHEHDALAYASEPLGIGGDEFFGGDNVTVATYEILCDRLEAVLNPQRGGRRVTLPLADLGRSRFLTGSGVGWENTRRIWEAAEVLKRLACRPGPVEEPRAANALESLISTLRGEIELGGSVKTVLLLTDPESEKALKEAIRSRSLLVPLESKDNPSDSIYDHKIRLDFHGHSNYTVRSRISRCVEKIRTFLAGQVRKGSGAAPDDKPVPEGPDVIILAGAGCRVPLAPLLLEKTFPMSLLVQDEAHAKSKVAYGLLRYLDLQSQAEDRVADLGMARDYSHSEIVWCESLFDRPHPWIPSCSPLNGPEWYPLKNIKLARCWKSNKDRTITVARDTAPAPEILGSFDLNKPGLSPDPSVNPQLPAEAPPDPSPGRPQVWLRFQRGGGPPAAPGRLGGPALRRMVHQARALIARGRPADASRSRLGLRVRPRLAGPAIPREGCRGPGVPAHRPDVDPARPGPGRGRLRAIPRSPRSSAGRSDRAGPAGRRGQPPRLPPRDMVPRVPTDRRGVARRRSGLLVAGPPGVDRSRQRPAPGQISSAPWPIRWTQIDARSPPSSRSSSSERATGSPGGTSPCPRHPRHPGTPRVTSCHPRTRRSSSRSASP